MIFVGGGEARDPCDHDQPGISPRRSHPCPVRRPSHRFPAADEQMACRDRESLDTGGPIASLSSTLVDEDAKVRLQAVTALTIVGGDQAVAALTTVALTDADSGVRQEAVYALGEIRTDAAIETLKHSLLDPEVRVREAAVDAFADIGGEKSALALAAALNDPDASLRVEVVDALGEIGGPTAIRLLRQASMDPHSAVRDTATELLAELSGGEKSRGCFQITPLARALRHARSSPNSTPRPWCICAASPRFPRWLARWASTSVALSSSSMTRARWSRIAVRAPLESPRLSASTTLVCSSIRGLTPMALTFWLKSLYCGERWRASHSVFTAANRALFPVDSAINSWKRRSASSLCATLCSFSSLISLTRDVSSESCSGVIRLAASAQVSDSIARRASNNSNGPKSVIPATPPFGTVAMTCTPEP